jgi:N-glycosylase/DNA lyase
VRVTEGRPGYAQVEAIGRAPARADAEAMVGALRHMLRLDEDLSGFYASVADDGELAWVRTGAGRMVRSPTVFEDVVKTICTTNCTWSATERMAGAIVAHLGVEDTATGRRAFPTPAAMAEAGESFYREVVRAGYRGAYLRALAADVASGALDLEELNDPALPDDEVARRLLALPGVGPYAAAHVMMLIGRYGRLILDSWTRPTYARLAGKGTVSDKAIERRFKRYRAHAGLAFWLFVTRDWLEVADPKP